MVGNPHTATILGHVRDRITIYPRIVVELTLEERFSVLLLLFSSLCFDTILDTFYMMSSSKAPACLADDGGDEAMNRTCGNFISLGPVPVPSPPPPTTRCRIYGVPMMLGWDENEEEQVVGGREKERVLFIYISYYFKPNRTRASNSSAQRVVVVVVGSRKKSSS